MQSAKGGSPSQGGSRMGFGSFWFKRQVPPEMPSLYLVGLRNSVQIKRPIESWRWQVLLGAVVIKLNRKLKAI